MKQVTAENVRNRIAEMVDGATVFGLSLQGEFHLACLRQLLIHLEAEDVKLPEYDEPKPGVVGKSWDDGYNHGVSDSAKAIRAAGHRITGAEGIGHTLDVYANIPAFPNILSAAIEAVTRASGQELDLWARRTVMSPRRAMEQDHFFRARIIEALRVNAKFTN